MSWIIHKANVCNQKGPHLGKTKHTSNEAQDNSPPKKLGIARNKFLSVCTMQKHHNVQYIRYNHKQTCMPLARLAGAGINTEHRAHGCLGLAWIWRFHQGVGFWQPLLQLLCRRTLLWQEKRVIIIIIILACRQRCDHDRK